MTALPRPASVLVIYHPSVKGAADVARALAGQATASGVQAHLEPLPPSDGDLSEDLASVDLIVCVGGDGTVLHTSHHAGRSGTPIFGVRMGRLGFLTESVEDTAAEDFARVLAGDARLDPRAMVQARLGDETFHALNDVVIGRARLGRTISVHAHVDGVLLAEYRADALVISTATGSTGYSLSVGGPILHPSSTDTILVPVAPHLTRANALVLPGDLEVRLSVHRGYEAVLSADGIQHRPIAEGSEVRITTSSRVVNFVRLGGDDDFYNHLARRLGWLRLDHVIDDPRPDEDDLLAR